MTGTRRPIRVLVAKAGLDGHDRGAKFIARSLRDDGFEVIYTGIRHTPEEIASVAIQEDVDAIGISLLSGAHNELIPAMIHALCQFNAGDIPVIVGGAIPQEDISYLKGKGVCEVLTTGTPTQTILNTFRTVANECHRKKHAYE